MWSAAALANLAASYCNTESGHCYWYYDTEVSDVVLYGAHDDEDAENTTTVITTTKTRSPSRSTVKGCEKRY